MATTSSPWRTSFSVPTTDGVHTLIHAFLRTSPHGSWSPDRDVPSDAFVLNYCRGEPLPAPPTRIGSLFRVILHDVAIDTWVASIKSPPTRLQVMLRPTASHILISLEFRLFGAYLDRLPPSWYRDAGIRFRNEGAALVRYLKELLHLPEIPAIEHD